MNYHNIQTDDMLNGAGLRVTLFVSGCENFCEECQNSQTWDFESGIPFDKNALSEIMDKLSPDYITGLTISGGDPLHEKNAKTVDTIVHCVKKVYKNKKDIWVYTGYRFEDILNKIKNNELDISLENIDVLVDGKYMPDLSDLNYHYAGSTNQSVINLKETLKHDNRIILYT